MLKPQVLASWLGGRLKSVRVNGQNDLDLFNAFIQATTARRKSRGTHLRHLQNAIALDATSIVLFLALSLSLSQAARSLAFLCPGGSDLRPEVQTSASGVLGPGPPEMLRVVIRGKSTFDHIKHFASKLPPPRDPEKAVSATPACSQCETTHNSLSRASYAVSATTKTPMGLRSVSLRGQVLATTARRRVCLFLDGWGGGVVDRIFSDFGSKSLSGVIMGLESSTSQLDTTHETKHE